jgi:hypothetical protein
VNTKAKSTKRKATINFRDKNLAIDEIPKTDKKDIYNLRKYVKAFKLMVSITP